MNTSEKEFEEAIANVRYSHDWTKMRDDVAEIMTAYIKSSHCVWFKRKRTSLDNQDFCFLIFFKMFDNLYIWSEAVENGLRESAQLEVMYNFTGVVRVLYSNMENSDPIAPLVIQSFIDNELYDYD